MARCHAYFLFAKNAFDRSGLVPCYVDRRVCGTIICFDADIVCLPGSEIIRHAEVAIRSTIVVIVKLVKTITENSAVSISRRRGINSIGTAVCRRKLIVGICRRCGQTNGSIAINRLIIQQRSSVVRCL